MFMCWYCLQTRHTLLSLFAIFVPSLLTFSSIIAVIERLHGARLYLYLMM